MEINKVLTPVCLFCAGHGDSCRLLNCRFNKLIPCAGVGVLALTFAWTIWWICAFVGTFNFLNGAEELSNGWMSVVMVFFVFSYYWTFQVIKVGCGALERVGFV